MIIQDSDTHNSISMRPTFSTHLVKTQENNAFAVLGPC